MHFPSKISLILRTSLKYKRTFTNRIFQSKLSIVVVHGVSLRVMLCKNILVLGKKALLFLLDYRHLDLLLLLFLGAFGLFYFALGGVDSKTFLPEPFDLAFVL